jgi:uncharacterized protein (TIGR00299 family) protein
MPHDHPDHDQPPRPAFRVQGRARGADEPHAQDMPEPQPLARGAGRGKLLFLDAFSGIAGDMLVAGLFDLGVPREVMTAALRSLPFAGYELHFVRRTRSGIAGWGLEVVASDPQPSRDYAAIRAMLEGAKGLEPGARALSLTAFRVLAEAEAKVHDSTPEQVHFHEVGAVDSIVDIVAAAAAFDHLGADVICSPLPMGRGFVRSEHGVIPSPAPATLLCLAGVPTYDASIDSELVTPTGACLVRAAAKSFARWPSMLPSRVGWGAGTRELPDRPNLLRLVLGEPTGVIGLEGVAQNHVMLELNVDDMTGELAAVALERAQQAGALDAWSTPIGMKKGRPALMLSALVRHGEADQVARALLSETTSLGIRLRDVGRIERSRRMVEVQTPYGPIAVKVADGEGLPANIAPEYERCRSAAEAHGVPVKQVYAVAIAAYLAQHEPR